MWVVVFVMTAGPLPLGIPRAEAASATAGITDTPGIRNFYTPRVVIIFDTSKSMAYRPNDPNSDPSVVGEDWDPNNPAAPCDNKFCLGKRSLYQTLPQYTSRIEIGLSGYNQYYQLTSQPANWYSDCYYDEIAKGSAQWNNWKYTSPTDLTGDPAVGAASPILSLVPPSGGAAHQTRKEGVNPTGLRLRQNFTGAGAGAGDTTVSAGVTYTWDSKVVGVDGAGFALTDTFTLAGAASCAINMNGYNAGTCVGAGNTCDLYLVNQRQNTFPPIVYGTSQGASFNSGGNTYTTAGGAPVAITGAACGLSSPYTGTGGGCDGVVGGCNLTQTNGPYPLLTGTTAKYYDNSFTPPGNWTLTSTGSGVTKVQLTAFGTTCPALGTVITSSSGPAEWQSLATGGGGPGTLLAGTGCANSPGFSCTWTAIDDQVIVGETYTHYCTFSRPVYTWTLYNVACDYTTQEWTYSTAAVQNTVCDYHHNQDQFYAPLYTYSYLPNDGDIIGGTYFRYVGYDHASGQPSVTPYASGSYSNGDCPNVVTTAAPCTGSTLCKLSWQSNTTLGATNYPAGRYSNGGSWWWTQTTLYPAADPPGTLTDPLFPPDPTVYAGDWLVGGGGGPQYWVNLMANYFDPSDTNPPNPPLFSCPTCTYQYSYQDPGLQLDPTTHRVLAASVPAAPAAFSSVAVAMPPTRDKGWARLDDGTLAVSWEPLATDNAIPGGTPASDGPLLKMFSKYDPVTNPKGFRFPDYGDYTPLSGALRNAGDYLQTVIDSDPYAGCGRRYYVMLLTDGEEFPDTLPLPANDPVGAVKRLRTMTTSGGVAVDVKTFVIGFGLLAPSPELNSMAQVGGTSVSAADLVTPDPTGTGVAFDGSNTGNLLRSLNAAFGKILEGFFTRSKPAVNLAGTEMYVGYFRILFNGLEWQGKLDAIDIDGRNLPTFADTVTDANYSYLWRYGDDFGTALPSSSINKQGSRTVYTSLNPNAGNRIFFDYSGCTGCSTTNGWNSNSGANQTTLEALIDPDPQVARSTIALLLNPGVPTTPELFTNGAKKTSRASDIFHSNPAIVEGAAQSASWPDATESVGYQAFKTLVSGRRKTVYIGANDGMVHAVEDAVTSPGAVVAPEAGSERWGYVPKSLLPQLSKMRDGHVYGADGSFGIADVCGPGFSLSPCTDPAGAGWTTLLVGALGKGGAGLYALDITDPTNPLPKWEVYNPIDEVASRGFAVRFGETWSPPVLGRANIGGKPWAVFVGGGVAPNKDSLGVPWSNTFYVLDARDGTLLTDGVTNAKFVIPDDPADDPVSGIDHANGVAARPTLYRPGDASLVSRVYFNDTEGKMWRMDTSSGNIANWSPTISADPFFDPASANPVCQLDVNGNPAAVLEADTGLPAMSAGVPVTLPLSKPRPKIFNRPMLAFDQTGLLNVYVGTGDTEHPNDPLGTQDYFWGLTDTGAGCGRPLFILRFAQNEKVLADPAFLNNVVYVTTYTPPPAASCNDAGRGFLYAFDARTGQPVKAITDPFTMLPTSKLDLGQNLQLKQSGIPSAPMIRNGKIYVALEADPAHPRQIDLGGQTGPVKVKGWQRVK
jgi:hypothetical protein